MNRQEIRTVNLLLSVSLLPITEHVESEKDERIHDISPHKRNLHEGNETNCATSHVVVIIGTLAVVHHSYLHQLVNCEKSRMKE